MQAKHIKQARVLNKLNHHEKDLHENTELCLTSTSKTSGNESEPDF